jgi:glycosyltransferase involved in cell wall biosynthesis
MLRLRKLQIKKIIALPGEHSALEKPVFENKENFVSVLDQLKRKVQNHPQDVNKLDQYYRQAVAQNRIESARNTISQLQRQFPENQQLIKTYIALCLQQQDYSCAMLSIEDLVAISEPENELIEAALNVRHKVGPRKIEKKHKTATTLSVCMIVKDEQAYLGPCLQSIKMFADEIVVVDTGSTDRTADIARIFGARVYDYQWHDDFAAARNYSLEKACGGWILVMDADEIISRKNQAGFLQFRDQLPEDDHLAFRMTTLNYTDQRESAGWVKDDDTYPEAKAKGWVPTEKVRLFPNHKMIRFVFPVQELVDPVLQKNGYRVDRCPIPILHFGKLDRDRKHERWQAYYRIGKQKLDSLGDQPPVLRELATQAALLDRLDEASDLWERFVRQRPDSINGWTNLASIYSRLGRYQQAAKAALKAAELAPDKIETLYNLVISDLQSGNADSAVKNSNRLLYRFPDYAQGHIIVAVTHICSGKLKDGIEMLKIVRKKVNDQKFIKIIAEVSAAILHAGHQDWIKAIRSAIEHTTR